MGRRSLLIAAVAVIAFGVFLERGSVMESQRVADELRVKMTTAPEASEWLRRSKHPSALASNRFGPTGAALAFVEKVYELGAVTVVIDPESLRHEQSYASDYADAIIVELPEDDVASRPVIELFRLECERDGYVLGPEVDHGLIFSWWD